MKKKFVYFASLGCSRNLVDSEVMIHKLMQANYHLSSEIENSDVEVNVFYVEETKSGDVVNAVWFSSKDIYIENQKPQSLLCIPLIYQNRTKGILYLENKKEQNVFNSERQNIIDLLSPQLAILIDNAEIFWELESLNTNLLHS